MDKLKPTIKLLLLSLIIFIGSFFFSDKTYAIYNPLECSELYPALCSEGSECADMFGSEGVSIYDHCYFVGTNYPSEFADELTGIEWISDEVLMIKSDVMQITNVITFWLPFGIIMIFALTSIYFILLKLRFFR